MGNSVFDNCATKLEMLSNALWNVAQNVREGKIYVDKLDRMKLLAYGDIINTVLQWRARDGEANGQGCPDRNSDASDSQTSGVNATDTDFTTVGF
jgi:hypothetical protein